MKYLYENVGVLGVEIVGIVIFGCVRGVGIKIIRILVT